jgi:hypothetical protein
MRSWDALAARASSRDETAPKAERAGALTRLSPPAAPKAAGGPTGRRRGSEAAVRVLWARRGATPARLPLRRCAGPVRGTWAWMDRGASVACGASSSRTLAAGISLIAKVSDRPIKSVLPGLGRGGPALCASKWRRDQGSRWSGVSTGPAITSPDPASELRAH